MLAMMGLGMIPQGGGDQEMQTFEGESRGGLSLDPRDMMGFGLTAMGRFGDSMNERLSQPINLPSSFVQGLPTFSGGGLPMPIGVTGRDPAEADPSMLTRQSSYTNRDPFQGIGNLMSGDPLAPKPGAQLRSPGNDILTGGQPAGDDMQEAMGAVDLLMGSMQRTQ